LNAISQLVNDAFCVMKKLKILVEKIGVIEILRSLKRLQCCLVCNDPRTGEDRIRLAFLVRGSLDGETE